MTTQATKAKRIDSGVATGVAKKPSVARAEIVDKATRARFEEEIDGALKPIIDWLWEHTEGAGAIIDCPEGYVDCHGVCVPYPCPDL